MLAERGISTFHFLNKLLTENNTYSYVVNEHNFSLVRVVLETFLLVVFEEVGQHDDHLDVLFNDHSVEIVASLLLGPLTGDVFVLEEKINSEIILNCRHQRSTTWQKHSNKFVKNINSLISLLELNEFQNRSLPSKKSGQKTVKIKP